MASKHKPTKQPKPRKPIKRQTRKFQLRVEHPKDAHVKEILDFARSQRREVTVIRDAIALYWALENDNLEVLFEMFPKHRAKLTSGGQGGGGVTAEALEIFMAELKTSRGYLMQSAADQPPKTVAPPVAEIKQSTGSVSPETIADNFLAAFT